MPGRLLQTIQKDRNIQMLDQAALVVEKGVGNDHVVQVDEIGRRFEFVKNFLHEALQQLNNAMSDHHPDQARIIEETVIEDRLLMQTLLQMHHHPPLEGNHQGEALAVHHQVAKTEKNEIQGVTHVEEELYPPQMMVPSELQIKLDLHHLRKERRFKANGTIETGHAVVEQDRQHEMENEVAADETTERGEMNHVGTGAIIAGETRRGREVVAEWRTKEIQVVKARDQDETKARGTESLHISKSHQGDHVHNFCKFEAWSLGSLILFVIGF